MEKLPDERMVWLEWKRLTKVCAWQELRVMLPLLLLLVRQRLLLRLLVRLSVRLSLLVPCVNILFLLEYLIRL